MFSTSKWVIFIYITLAVIMCNGYCVANDSVLKIYLNRQIQNEESINSNNSYKEYLGNNIKKPFFDITKLSSYGSYSYQSNQTVGSVELGFYFKLYDFQKDIEMKIAKNNLFKVVLDEETIIQNVIFNSLNNYFEFVIHKELEKEYKILDNFKTDTLNTECILIYNDLQIRKKEIALLLENSTSKEFDEIYRSVGTQIFKEELYDSINQGTILYKILNNNIQINKLIINQIISGLDSSKNSIMPKIYLDGSYQYDFDNTHDLRVSVNTNIVIPTKWSDIDIDITLLKDQISYYVNFIKKGTVRGDKQQSSEEVKNNLLYSLEKQYDYYLRAIKISKEKIENSERKIEYYKEKSCNDIKFTSNYLNEKMLYYNYLKELNSFYLLILFIGNVSDCMYFLK